jgi:hypothetical protein
MYAMVQEECTETQTAKHMEELTVFMKAMWGEGKAPPKHDAQSES